MTGAHNGKSGALAPIEPDGIKGAEALPMSDPAMLKAFLDYGAENYPAQKYDAVFMGHGSGPTMGWCAMTRLRTDTPSASRSLTIP